MCLSRHGVVGTASRMYVNKLCMLIGPCPAVLTWPEEYSHSSAKLCTNCLKLSGHTGRHDRIATRCSLFVQNVCTKCLDLSGHIGCRGGSEQLVATGRATGSPRFLCQLCRTIIMLCRVATIATRTSQMSCTVGLQVDCIQLE